MHFGGLWTGSIIIFVIKLTTDPVYNLLSRADLIYIYIEKSMLCVKQLALLYGNLIMMVYVKYKVSSLPQYIYWDGKPVYFA